ncbi:hypothetical protein EB796_006183 [Bugula neritina]|uniref:Uncharacterized protein n=1 Tax=Bugula neritina TaxID=10212 RepID=A0A7J7KB62_BUGNE|nr:hypothetical protein EB796_006183 [Bugula neritina]
MSITRQVSKVLVITHWDPNSSPVLSTSEFAVSKMYCLSMKIGMSYPARNLAGLVISRALSSGLFVVVTNSSTTSLVVTPENFCCREMALVLRVFPYLGYICCTTIFEVANCTIGKHINIDGSFGLVFFGFLKSSLFIKSQICFGLAQLASKASRKYF